MPASPSKGPGNWFVLFVPEEQADAARRVSTELSFEIGLNPDVWDCQPTEAKRKLWRRFTIAYIVFIIVLTLAIALASGRPR